MKRTIIGLTIGLIVVSSLSFGKDIKQTICFSQKDIGAYPGGKGRIYMAVLGDSSILNGGKCQGKTLSQMNKMGWKLIQVVGGLESSFGMLFEKIK